MTTRAGRPCSRRALGRTSAARLLCEVHRTVEAHLGRELFSSPALEMILDLYARDEKRPISLKTLCGAASAPTRTALFTINRLVEHRILARHPDASDGRRTNVELTTAGHRMLDDCLAQILKIIGKD
jgi:DNA-binding MarR family transcriptional regulator